MSCLIRQWNFLKNHCCQPNHKLLKQGTDTHILDKKRTSTLIDPVLLFCHSSNEYRCINSDTGEVCGKVLLKYLHWNQRQYHQTCEFCLIVTLSSLYMLLVLVFFVDACQNISKQCSRGSKALAVEFKKVMFCNDKTHSNRHEILPPQVAKHLSSVNRIHH